MTLEEARRTYYNKVYRHCLKELYYNEKAAEDTTQETFAALCHSWPKLDHDNFEPWLWKTAHNLILKAKANHTKWSLNISASDDTYPDPSTEADIHEQIVRQKIEERIDRYQAEIYSKLTDRERKLADCLRKKMKYADIAKELGSTPGAVSMAVVRLNRKVREIVRQIVENIL